MVLAFVSLLLLIAGAGLAAYAYLGRTPDELVTYLQRRLEGHPLLEAVALPVLGVARDAIADGDEYEALLPFVVPPRPANPARVAASTLPADDPRVIRVGPGRPITRIAVAAEMARDGSIVEIDAGDYVADVAVWTQRSLTIRGLGDRVRLRAAGADAEGKAIWVFRNADATVENIEFLGARAADRNGAAIRFESGRLRVSRCTFWGNQNGIMTASEPSAELVVEQSEFGYNGGGDGLTHGLYIGAIGRFRLTGSYLHHGNVGHLVKSRARTNRIEYNRITDEIGGRSSYELEFPSGGLVDVVGNVIQQTRGSRNSTIVSFGAEGYRWDRNRLALVHNTVVNDQRFGGTLIRVWPGGEPALLRNNLLVGPGRSDIGDKADVAGDARAEWSDLVRPSREDYRPTEEAAAALAAQPLGVVPPGLAPSATYEHPLGLRPLGQPLKVPGALMPGPATPPR